MKIWGDVPKVSGVYGKQKSVGMIEQASAVKRKKDVLSISTQAKDYQAAIKAVKETPDVRQDKVNEIQKKYESGTYDVKGREILEKVARSIVDKKV